MKTTELDREVLTPEEVADYLACGRTKAYELISEGTIRSFRVGRLRRVRRSDLTDFIEKQATKGEV